MNYITEKVREELGERVAEAIWLFDTINKSLNITGNEDRHAVAAQLTAGIMAGRSDKPSGNKNVG